MRTFVAIELDDACRRRLASALDSLRGAVPGVRWVKPEGAHLTLKFIGELEEPDLPAAIAALTAPAAAARPFVMACAGIGAFPPRGPLRVIHMPVEEPTGALESLVRAVDECLAEGIGLARETRSFKPHVTLGRVKRPRDCPALEEIAARAGETDFGEVMVEEIVLMRSQLTPQGAVYTALTRLPFGSQ